MKKFLSLLIFFIVTGTSICLAQPASLVNVTGYYNSSNQHYFYTTGGSPGVGWSVTGVIGRLIPTSYPDTRDPVYRYVNNSTGGHYYTPNLGIAPDGYTYEGVIGYQPHAPLSGQSYPIYEFHKYGPDDYYYSNTNNAPSGYTLNGISYYVYQ